MTDHVLSFRVFLSSASDVEPECAVALRVLERIQQDPEFQGQVELVPTSRQQNFNTSPAQCELTLVICWGRAAPLLPPKPADHTSGEASAAEWAVENALNAGKPVLIYHKTAPLGPLSAEQTAEAAQVAAFLARREQSLDTSYSGLPQPFDTLSTFEARLESDVKRSLRLQLLRWRTPQTFSRPPVGYENECHPDGTPFARFHGGHSQRPPATYLLCHAAQDSETAGEVQRLLSYQGLQVELAIMAALPADPAQAIRRARTQGTRLIFLHSRHLPMTRAVLPQPPVRPSSSAAAEPTPAIAILSLDPPPPELLTGIPHWDLRTWWLLGDGASFQSMAHSLGQAAGYMRTGGPDMGSLMPTPQGFTDQPAPPEHSYALPRRTEYLDRFRDYLAAREAELPNADIALAVLELAQSKAIHDDHADETTAWKPLVYEGRLLRVAPLKPLDGHTEPRVALALHTGSLPGLAPNLERNPPLLVVLKQPSQPTADVVAEAQLLQELNSRDVPCVTQPLASIRGHLALPFYRHGDLHNYADLEDEDYPQDRQELWAAIKKVWRREAPPLSSILTSDQSAQLNLLGSFIDLVTGLLSLQRNYKNFVHRNIKPSNILVDVHDGQLVLHLADFRHAQPSGVVDRNGGRGLSAPYQAAEAATSPRANTDVYSLGLTIAAVLLRRAPPLDSRNYVQRAFLQEPGTHGCYLHHGLLDVLHRALTPEAALRSDLNELKSGLLAVYDQVRRGHAQLLVNSRWESLITEISQSQAADATADATPSADRSGHPSNHDPAVGFPGQSDANLAVELLTIARNQGAQANHLPPFQSRKATTHTPDWFLSPYRDHLSKQSRVWCFATLREWRGNSPGRRLLGWDRRQRCLVFLKASAGGHEAQKLIDVRHLPGCAQILQHNVEDHWLTTRFVRRGVTLQQACGLMDHTSAMLLPVRRYLQPLGLPWLPSSTRHQRTWLRVMLDLVRLLQQLEQEGLYHFDVNPANLILTGEDPAALPHGQSSVCLCDFDTAFTLNEWQNLAPEELHRIKRSSKFLPHWLRTKLAEPHQLAEHGQAWAKRAHVAAVAATMAAIAWVRQYPEDAAPTMADFIAKSPLSADLLRIAHQAVSPDKPPIDLADFEGALVHLLRTDGVFALSPEAALRRNRRGLRNAAGLPAPLEESSETSGATTDSDGEITDRPEAQDHVLPAPPFPADMFPRPSRAQTTTGGQSRSSGRTSFLVTSLILPLLAAIAVALFVTFQSPVHDAQQSIALPQLMEKHAELQAEQLISEKVVWRRGESHLLQGTVVIGPNGSLRIEPGTTVFTDYNSMLVVAPGGELIAAGTPARPIRFLPRPGARILRGHWRGISVLGCAETLPDPENSPHVQNELTGVQQAPPVFSCGGTPQNTLEACAFGTEPCAYGTAPGFTGQTQRPTRGRIKYVELQHAGAHIGTNSEANALTLAGIPLGFELEHVVVRHTIDDCFEFFGGEVSASHLTCLDAEDDAFDASLGYRGALRYLYAANEPHIERIDCAYGRNGLEVEIEAQRDNNEEGMRHLQGRLKPLVMDVVIRGLHPRNCSGSYAIRSPDRVWVANLHYVPDRSTTTTDNGRIYSGRSPALQESWTISDQTNAAQEYSLATLRVALPDAAAHLTQLQKTADDSARAAWQAWSSAPANADALPPWYRQLQRQ